MRSYSKPGTNMKSYLLNLSSWKGVNLENTSPALLSDSELLFIDTKCYAMSTPYSFAS